MNYRQHIDSTPDLARWYDDKYTEMGDGWHTPVEECRRHLDDLGVPVNKALRLLDVGCGAGHFLAEASKRANCSGSEISDVGANLSRQRAPDATIALVSIEDWKYWGTAPYDYIVSIGSLEHIVNLILALDNIRKLLKPDGKFYFYCPNERWPHMDQPNERTMTDPEWIALFAQHGLKTLSSKRWGDNQDNTAFIGMIDNSTPKYPGRDASHDPAVRCTKINAGSGQRPFDRSQGWINVDINPKWEPDLAADVSNLPMFADGSIDMVVSHHCIEHSGCGEADGFIHEAYRILRPGGRLLVFIPDPKALCQRYLAGEISEYIFNVNMYGAFMGDEADRHRWSYSRQGLVDYLQAMEKWHAVYAFNWREIPGASLAQDWWITGIEAVK